MLYVAHFTAKWHKKMSNLRYLHLKMLFNYYAMAPGDLTLLVGLWNNDDLLQQWPNCVLFQ